MSTTLLLTDAERAWGAHLERSLRHDGFEVVSGETGRARPDLVLAGEDAELERWCGEAPVIVLGHTEADPRDRVRAFRRGCDDYLARPFSYDELVARIRAVLRRAGPRSAERLVAGPVEIDFVSRVVRAGGTPLVLSQKEFALIACLAREPRRVFTKEELLRDVWGFVAHVRTRTLDSHVSRLRRKFRAADPATPYLENEWGVGYRLLGLHL
jgi:DNA-binding response OmpR family regulator